MELLDLLQEEWMLIVYLGLLMFILVTLLCGDWPVFDHTPVRSLYLWISGGACDCLQGILQFCCGSRGVRSYEYVEHICCERSNPILQIFYLFIIVGAFVTYYFTSFHFIPGLYISSIHRYMGPLAVVIGIGIFLMASFSDPGVITASNVQTHENIYPFDDTIFVEKTCSTCNIPRPARSKHCSICNRCIARFDHHCGWMNTCIGANNLRYFLSFLIWHCLLCLYGAALLIAILAGEVKEHRILERITFYYGLTTFWDQAPHLLQWMLTFYNYQVLLMLFLLIVLILLAAFSVYHVYLVGRNTTTNEVYKWDIYKRWYAEGRRAQEELDIKESTWSCGFFSKKYEPVRNNVYNRGLSKNFGEVLFPLQKRNHYKQQLCCRLVREEKPIRRAPVPLPD